jgi:galactokinase
MAGPLKQKSGLEGPVSGLPSGRYEVLIHGDLPIGAGLSSSASLEAASALWLAEIGAADGGDAPPRWDDSARFDLARKLCALEARAAGVACGLLDQFSVLLGAQDHALWLDCATLQYGRLPLGEPAPCLVVCDTKTSRRLAEGMYNARRAECEFVLSHFQARNPGASPVSLRGVAQVDLERDWADLDPVARLRARHVITEIERVRRGIAMLQAGNTTAFAQLMGDSHRSSRDDFGNSSPALDAMYESACGAPGFLGGKLSGAGWAGCTVNLVEPARSIEFERHVRAKYREATGREPDIWTCRASEGARAWRLS